MKLLLLTLSCFLTMNLFAQENYLLQIGGKTYSLGLDSTYRLDVQGQKLTLSLKQKDTLRFVDSLFSFSYPKGFQYSKTKIENAGEQYAILTAAGSGYMIQKYWALNPTLMTDIMLQEITKQNIGYGYAEKKETYTRTLASGQTLRVTKDVLTYKDKVNTFEIASLGGKDEGVMVITVDMGADQGTQSRDLIQLLWNSFTYNR